MKLAKRWAALLLCGMLFFAMAGCGCGTSQNSESSSSETSSEFSSTPSESPSGGNVENPETTVTKPETSSPANSTENNINETGSSVENNTNDTGSSTENTQPSTTENNGLVNDITNNVKDGLEQAGDMLQEGITEDTTNSGNRMRR